MFKKLKIQVSKKSLIFLAVFAVLLAADLLTKFIEEKYNLNFTVIPNFIWVESGVRNSGASFSLFSDAAWGQTFLKIITILMIIVILAVFLVIPERFTVMKVSLAAVLAGALGNLIDRFMLGEVRDFVWVNMIFTEACCNFADFWITFGMAVIIIDLLFLNEWAIFPLTKKARLAQKAAKEEQANVTAEQTEADEITESNQSESTLNEQAPRESGDGQNDS